MDLAVWLLQIEKKWHYLQIVNRMNQQWLSEQACHKNVRENEWSQKLA